MAMEAIVAAAAAGAACANLPACSPHNRPAAPTAALPSSAQRQPHSCRSSFAKIALIDPATAWTSSRKCVRRRIPRAKMWGEDPEWSDDDYIVLGLAHCFLKNEDDKLTDLFVIEPIPAGGLECMENGGKTSYKHATATTLGVALQQDASLLPPEFRAAQFAESFDFRTKCASRTWKRKHPQQNLLHLVPREGVRSDFNFSLEDKRILNMKVVVTDADNIKQDLSIDVYGRAKENDEEQLQTDISSLYNV